MELKFCKHSKQGPSLSNFIYSRNNEEEDLKKPCKHTLLLFLNVVLISIVLSVKFKGSQRLCSIHKLRSTAGGQGDNQWAPNGCGQAAGAWRRMWVYERPSAVANIFCPNRKWALWGGWLPLTDPIHHQIKRIERPLPIQTPEVFSALFESAGVGGGRGGVGGGAGCWLRAARCHSACGPVAMMSSFRRTAHKELMAAGIMQWYARRLFSSFVPPSPHLSLAGLNALPPPSNRL